MLSVLTRGVLGMSVKLSSNLNRKKEKQKLIKKKKNVKSLNGGGAKKIKCFTLR